ncbi:precorrin-6A synthase (deacetylating) [Marmoricola sp. URHB0036]|uniref:precorrin-6A synthase (deacetylating) n=1 Tax=Marmoricola sp. URHB0036 TaxID=1298863 RepID=UPI00040D1DFE|nr:precorrin-6A synthase (deacetylating) [Marmoricola sp. URHB0036]
MRRIRVLGVGMGPQHVTPEVAEALRSVDYVLAAQKSSQDGLLEARREICRVHGDVPLVAVPDPERDRDAPRDYPRAVADWHEARVAAYEQVLLERPGDVAFLVWGDPSLYDSTIRIVESIHARGRAQVEYDVLPGISAVQLLAARHRIVLHEVGRPLHVTTSRLLREALETGQDNIAVLLNARLELDGLEDWQIWWGANLGTPDEALVAGRVGDVLAEIDTARAKAKEAAGWVMDIYLLRRVS